MKWKWNFISVFLFTILFYLKGITLLDPDFGWHYRVGEWILHHGIPYTDPFSYTMPQFFFPYHDWLTTIGMYLGYNSLGFNGLAGVFAFIFFVTLCFHLSNKNYWLYSIHLIFVALTLLNFGGVRGQVVSWLFFSIFVKVLFTKTLWKKWGNFLPLLFFVWANMHGGFAIGIGTLFIFVITQTIYSYSHHRRIEYRPLLILFFSLLVTCINPYGYHLWGSILMQSSDIRLNWTLSEWVPVIFGLSWPHLLVIPYSIAIIIVYRKQIGLTRFMTIISLFLYTLTSTRHVSLWMIASLPLALESYRNFYHELSRHQQNMLRFRYVFMPILLISIAILLYQIPFIFYRANLLSETRFYPSKAITYIKKLRIKGEIFSDYTWGGYLLWKLPEKRVFIDGRMPSWHTQQQSQSKNAYKEYMDIYGGKILFKEVTKKYNIELVLLPKYLFYLKKDDKLKLQNLINAIEHNSFQKVYEDATSVIYRKVI